MRLRQAEGAVVRAQDGQPSPVVRGDVGRAVGRAQGVTGDEDDVHQLPSQIFTTVSFFKLEINLNIIDAISIG